MATATELRRAGPDPAWPADRRSRPQVTLITADGGGDTGLRARARALCAPSSDHHVSRSYCHPYGVMAIHSAPVGIDIECVEDDDPGLLASITTPSERALDAGCAGGVTSLWSSKEALAKALGDARDYDPRRLESPAFWPGGRCGRWHGRSLPLVDGYVVWIVWQEAPGCGA